MSPKLRENLASCRDQVFLNHQLMQLVRDVDVEADPASWELAQWDPREVEELFEELEFHSSVGPFGGARGRLGPGTR